MEGIADFLDTLLGGINLVAYALAVGSFIWGLFVLRPWTSNGTETGWPTHLCIDLLYKGAFGLAGVQLGKLVIKAWLIAETLDSSPFPAYWHTLQFQGGAWRLILALALGLFALYSLKKNPHSLRHWGIGGAFTTAVIISGAWLVHAAGRFDLRGPLMSLTCLHQVGAAIWLGGIAQLLKLWRQKRSEPAMEAVWRLCLARFSTLGMGAVALLLLSGLPLAWTYVQTWNGFIGTGYGNLLMVKILLLILLLAFAALNYQAVQQHSAGIPSLALVKRVPHYIEVESFILVSVLFTAASLSSQPPAVDIPHLTASWQEVLAMFQPHMPRLTSPSLDELLAGEAGRVAIIGQVPSVAATDWSDYNHNMSGLFLVTMGFVGMLSYSRRFSWGENWPLGFVGLAIFLFFRSDAETWPLGPIGFWESTFQNGEVLQHRLATLLTFALGVMEWRARRKSNQHPLLPYIFPMLCAFGGLMLLTHSHTGFEEKTEFLIQISHTMMGFFAMIMACSRWLELRLEGPGATLAGFISVSAMSMIGLLLIIYKEPLY